MSCVQRESIEHSLDSCGVQLPTVLLTLECGLEVTKSPRGHNCMGKDERIILIVELRQMVLGYECYYSILAMGKQITQSFAEIACRIKVRNNITDCDNTGNT